QLVREVSDRSEQRRGQGPGLAEGVGDAMELALDPHQRARREGPQPEGPEVEEPPGFRVGGQQYLEPPVEEEAIHPVRPHPPAWGVGGFQDYTRDVLLLQPQRAAEARHTGPDDYDLPTRPVRF